ncbi:MAG: 3-oxoadipate enol-lactonase [Alphaproteobacteria bacterium]|nr:3-oxoadipate enol-lactonase [Alphaproteobacteria bacterium]MCA0449111.1 3-oxoadipate enol-lactonase [Pseudomonadota bacterium]
MIQVARDGFTLAMRIDRAADAAAPWIVLSNSLAADHRMWDAQIPLLTRTHNVLRYDTRGHGASGVPKGPYSFADLVADAVAVMDHHGIAKAVFIGLSLGGMTGLGMALAHPDRLSALICCDARADAPPPYVQGWRDRIAAIEKGGMDAIASGTIERWLGAAFRAQHPEIAGQLAETIRTTPVEGYRGCAAALMALDYRKDLPKIAMPCLFIVGADDLAAPPDAMRDMAQAVTGAEFVMLPAAAHIANVENAVAFDGAIADFLARLK